MSPPNYRLWARDPAELRPAPTSAAPGDHASGGWRWRRTGRLHLVRRHPARRRRRDRCRRDRAAGEAEAIGPTSKAGRRRAAGRAMVAERGLPAVIVSPSTPIGRATSSRPHRRNGAGGRPGQDPRLRRHRPETWSTSTMSPPVTCWRWSVVGSASATSGRPGPVAAGNAERNRRPGRTQGAGRWHCRAARSIPSPTPPRPSPR